MSLLTALKPKAAAVRRPGRHTPLGITERLTAERDDALAAAADLTVERDEARGRSNANRDGWIRARQELGKVRAERDAAVIEVEHLRATLLALEVPVESDAAPGQPALMDSPEAWINQPDGPPRPDEWISPVAPVAPVASEAADVNARTQAVDVRDLRQGAEATQQMALPVAWTIAAVPSFPPEVAPTLTMPLANAPMATEVSGDAADSARRSVADAMAAPA
jgi:hypothetical protein